MLSVLRWFGRPSAAFSRRHDSQKTRFASASLGAAETLEERILLTFVMSAQEQLLVELVNRARQDPQAEAARLGVSVEQTGFRAPLAPHQLLINAAGAHSQNMLDLDFFAHTALDGSGPLQRVQRTGYPANVVSENIAWVGTTGPADVNAFTVQIHRNLFLSPGHREGMLDSRMLEVGVGLRAGEFIDEGRTWNALMGTEVFATRTGNHFITGVAFTDQVVDDAFYSIGEGLGNITVTARNQTTGTTFTTTTGPSGGYSLEVPGGTYTVTFSGDGLPTPAVQQNISVSGQNRKIDFDQSNQRATTLPRHLIVSGADAGGGAHVRVFDAQTGFEWLSFLAYHPDFHGGVRVATGDVNGDGVLDIITTPGAGGGPHVMVFHGRTGVPIASFFAYDPGFAGGLFVAAGDVNGDGRADIITGPGAGGGPHVRVFSGLDLQIISEFMAYSPQFLGGVHVAAGNVDGAGFADIITAPGAGGGPHVRVFDGQTGQMLNKPAANFFAFSPLFQGGVWVASADVNLDGRSDIITGAGAGGGPHVRVFDAATGADINGFFAYAQNFTGGVRVGSSDVDNNGRPDILTAPGPGGSPNVRAYQGLSPTLLSAGAVNFMAYSTGFLGGVHIAGGRNQTLNITQTAEDATVGQFSGSTLSSAIINPSEGEPIIGLMADPNRTADVTSSTGQTGNDEESDLLESESPETMHEGHAAGNALFSHATLDELFADKLLLADVWGL